jgi:protein TonB
MFASAQMIETAAAPDMRARVAGALGAALVQLLLGAALLWGLGESLPRAAERTLELFDILPPPPPPPPVVRPPPRVQPAASAHRQNPGREGEASPPNIRSEATQIVLPPPVVPLPATSPVIAAPIAGVGSDASSGAAEIAGPGTGAGGIGNGRGSGAGGDGDGGGGGPDRPPRHLRGRLGNSDYPEALGVQGAGGTVSVRFTVALDGRAVNCRITDSSGYPALDALTCRLIEQRYRFDPSRDGRGRPILSDVVEDHTWEVADLPPEDD